MASPSRPRPPLAGGLLIAVGAIGGAAVGEAYRQPTIGFLVGLGVAVAAALVLWFADRGSA